MPQRRTSRTLSQLGVLDSIDPARPMPHVEPAAAIDSTTGAVLPRDLLPGEDRDQMINPFGVRPPRPIFEPNQPMRPGYFRFTTA